MQSPLQPIADRPLTRAFRSLRTCARNSYYVNLELFEAYSTPLDARASRPPTTRTPPHPGRGYAPPFNPGIDSVALPPPRHPWSSLLPRFAIFFRQFFFHARLCLVDARAPRTLAGYVGGGIVGRVFGLAAGVPAGMAVEAAATSEGAGEAVGGRAIERGSGPGKISDLGPGLPPLSPAFVDSSLDADGTGGLMVYPRRPNEARKRMFDRGILPFRAGSSVGTTTLSPVPAFSFDPGAGNGRRAILPIGGRSGKSRAEGRGTRALRKHHGNSPTQGKPGQVRDGVTLFMLAALIGCSSPVGQSAPPPEDDTTTYPARRGPGIPLGCRWEWAPTVHDSVMVCPDPYPPGVPR
jgi:hypothetical protein